MFAHESRVIMCLFVCATDAERAGRGPCVMCVNATRPVNTAPARRRGIAPVTRAGGGSSVTKVSPHKPPAASCSLCASKRECLRK